MAEEKQQNQKPKNAKRTRKRVWLAAIVGAITVLIVCLFWSRWNSNSVDERLAAIEAARAIPDEENAATIYNQLMQDPNATLLLDYRPGFLDDDSDNLTFLQPWSGKDFPELAVWIKEQQHVFDRLLEASKFDKCRFPIAIDPVQRSQPSQPYRAMRKWTFLLRRAANNDIGEGRIDDAIDKWRCLLQMSNHLRQQPLFIEYLVALAIEAVALNQTVVFLVEGNADESHLRKVETLPLHTEDDWSAVLEEILPVEELLEQKMKEKLGLLDRLKYEFNYGLFGSMKDPDYNQIHQLSLRGVATYRGIHILVALRRYRNEHGRWPESLDDIQSQVPEEMLIDPFNSDNFVYKLTDNAFRLYSKGKNNVDEDGQYRDPQDDWPIWPPRGRKPKAKEENTNDE